MTNGDNDGRSVVFKEEVNMSKKMSKKSHESLSVMAYNTYNVCTWVQL